MAHPRAKYCCEACAKHAQRERRAERIAEAARQAEAMQAEIEVIAAREAFERNRAEAARIKEEAARNAAEDKKWADNAHNAAYWRDRARDLNRSAESIEYAAAFDAAKAHDASLWTVHIAAGNRLRKAADEFSPCKCGNQTWIIEPDVDIDSDIEFGSKMTCTKCKASRSDELTIEPAPCEACHGERFAANSAGSIKCLKCSKIYHLEEWLGVGASLAR